MRPQLLRRALSGSLLAVSLGAITSPAPAAAQDAGTAPADTRDDEGFDEGLLGLLGLAGLLGLRRRDRNDRGKADR